MLDLYLIAGISGAALGGMLAVLDFKTTGQDVLAGMLVGGVATLFGLVGLLHLTGGAA